MGDIFGDLFGMGGRGRSNRKRKGADMQTQMSVTLEEVSLGVNKKLNYTRNAKCKTCDGQGNKTGSKIIDCKKCSGSGQIKTNKRTIFGTFQQNSPCDDCEGAGKIPEHKCSDCRGIGILKKNEEVNIPIPAGVEDGESLILKGYGDTESRGESGDLYINIKVLSHKIYERKGLDLHAKIDIKITDFILGTSKYLEFANEKIEIKIPHLHNPKDKILLKEKGLKRDGYRKGNIVVDFNIQMPRKISKEEEEVLRNI
jgi:molecular chaperone DnaJ